MTVVSRGALTDRDFASRTGRGAVGGTVFEDHDGDLTRDGADEGVADVSVYVDTDDDGAYDDGEPEQTTDADGAYRFAGLPAGEHAIRIEAPADWLCLTAGCARRDGGAPATTSPAATSRSPSPPRSAASSTTTPTATAQPARARTAPSATPSAAARR